jgi:hypothetical protein
MTSMGSAEADHPRIIGKKPGLCVAPGRFVSQEDEGLLVYFAVHVKFN